MRSLGVGLGVNAGFFGNSVPFNVLDLPELAAWWDVMTPDGYSLTGSNITNIVDKSGNGRDLPQAQAFAPFFEATGGPGGTPAARYPSFTGSATATSFAGASAYTVFLVMKLSGTLTDIGAVFVHQDGTFPGFKVGASPSGDRRLEHGIVSTFDDGASDSAFHVWCARGGTGATFVPELFIDGTLVSAFGSASYSPTTGGQSNALGWRTGSGGGGGVVYHCETIYCDVKLSDADMAAANAYLKAKWGTP